MPISIQSKYFLTRQSANIMADLEKRLKVSESVSVLHGARGTGKTRLLMQFFEHRQALKNYIFICFKAGNTYVLNNQDLANDSIIDNVILNRQPNDVIVLDQFDNASLEIQNSIFRYWSDEAFNKQSKLVLSIQKESLSALIELSRGYPLTIECVELKPLTYEEQKQYLEASCCGGLRQSLLLSSKLKKLLKGTGGEFSQLVSFKEQNGNDFICKEKTLGIGSNRSALAILVGLLLLVILVIYDGLNTKIFKSLWSVDVDSSFRELNDRNSIPRSSEADIDSRSSVPKFNSPQKEQSEGARVKLSTTNPGEQKSTARTISAVDRPPATPVSAVPKPEKKPVADITGFEQTLFQQRLLASRRWLDTADKKSFSIQIMTLYSDLNSLKSLNRYLQKLQLTSVDLTAIKIYPFSKANKKMYGLIYGEFSSITQANRAIKQLPDILNANKPFPRTVKGIRDEMNW